MSASSLRRCRLPFLSARTGSSTAQANLAKILSIIVTVPPSTAPTDSLVGNVAFPDGNDISTTPPEVAVNLDLRLGLSLEMPRGSEAFTTAVEEEDEGIPTAHSGVVNCPNQTLSYEASTVNKVSKKVPSAVDSISEADTSSEGECSPEAAPIKHGTKEISEITNTSCKMEDDINKEAEGRGGYLDLLLEAARQVSSECGNDLDDENDEKPSSTSPPPPPPPPPPPAASGTRKRTRSSPPPLRSKPRKKSSPTTTAAAAMAFNACDEAEPIVRSRRGRNQALPSRYRDSILEPWRKPPTVFRR